MSNSNSKRLPHTGERWCDRPDDEDNPRDPLQELESWGLDIVSPRNESGRLRVTPATEVKTWRFVDKCWSLQEKDDTTVTEYRNLVDQKEKLRQHINKDVPLAAALHKLQRLLRDAWLLRYCEYFDAGPSDLLWTQAQSAKKTRARRERSDRRKAARLEPGVDTRAPPQSDEEARSIFLAENWDIKTLSKQFGESLRYGSVIDAIAFYTRRIDHHSIHERFKSHGPSVELALRIDDDIKALGSESSITTDEKAATKNAILRMARVYFETFRWDDARNEFNGLSSWPSKEDFKPSRAMRVGCHEDMVSVLEGLADTFLEDLEGQNVIYDEREL
ncbi:hypothetical protein GE09DRAFT_1262320 [Coniochaeta sp. 2T2.1]|nr:hypothetical protein GE09DRAFT_1262320 [Coniochaeta sp. 2T2.1]